MLYKNQEGQLLRTIQKCALHEDYLRILFVCKHIDQKTAPNIVILRNGDMLCQSCYHTINQINENNVVNICAQCVREILEYYKAEIKKAGGKIEDYIIGLENHDSEKGCVDMESLIDEVNKKEPDKGIWNKRYKKLED